MMEARDAGEPGGRNKRLRWVVVGAAVLIALIAWLATKGDDGSSEPTKPAIESEEPRIVDIDELREAADRLDQPIYWAGPIDGKELQLTELGSGGGAQVAYVPDGTEAGKGSKAVLTIGSYPLPDPEAAVAGFAKREGSTTRNASDGREVATSAESPTSVYFASADNSVQVEVYDPSPQKAMSIAISDKVEPVG